jgi:hypothetical protein
MIASALFLLCLVQRLDQFGPRGVEAPHHYLAHSLKQFVTEAMIFIAELAQSCAVKKNSSGGSDCPGMVVPAVWRKQP